MTDGSRPLVTVVLTTYNRADLLPVSLASVLGQDYPNMEVIVVDDGSTDDTPQLMRERFADEVRYLRSEENGGYAAAVNIGLRAAGGELIALQDDDDIWLPGKLTAQVDALERRRDCGLAYGRALTATPDGRSTGLYFGNSHLGRTGDNFELVLRLNPFAAPLVVFRAECLQDVGLLDESLVAAADYEWQLRAVVRYPAVYVRRSLLLVREHEGRMTRAKRGRGVKDMALEGIYGRLLASLPPEREHLRGLIEVRRVGAEINCICLACGGRPWEELRGRLASVIDRNLPLFDDFDAHCGLAGGVLNLWGGAVRGDLRQLEELSEAFAGAGARHLAMYWSAVAGRLAARRDGRGALNACRRAMRCSISVATRCIGARLPGRMGAQLARELRRRAVVPHKSWQRSSHQSDDRSMEA